MKTLLPGLRILLVAQLILCQTAHAQVDKKLCGGWERLGDHKNVVEIFIQKPDGVFISNGFDRNGNFKYLEKGKWGVIKDSIYFSFDYQASCSQNGEWKVAPKSKLQPEKYAFTLQADSLLNIQGNIYHKGIER
jgi:hypothetical protein